MADDLLSQEEIDALLSGMAKGEVDLEGNASRDAEVIPYDLTSKSVMLHDQFSALEEVFIKFTNYLQAALSTSLKKPIDIEFVASEMTKYEDYINGLTTPAGFNVFSMDPLVGASMVVLEPALLFSLIDCMFGGTGKPLTIDRELTVIDKRMMEKIVTDVLEALEEAWQSIHKVRPELKFIETRPEFVHLVAPDNYIITNNFEINGGEFKGQFFLCLSYLMLEPIKEKLSAAYLNKKDADLSWRVQLQRLLKDTDVMLVAELGRTQCAIRDLLDLKVNDVLKLDTGPEDFIRVNVENIEKFNGYPGIIKGNRAVQIANKENQMEGM